MQTRIKCGICKWDGWEVRLGGNNIPMDVCKKCSHSSMDEHAPSKRVDVGSNPSGNDVGSPGGSDGLQNQCS